MNLEERARSDSISRTKRPGPRPTACIWCQKTDCQHCRCTGQTGCNHKKGEICPNPRYKRRLVCNSCEKNKLREKQQSNASQVMKRKREKAPSKTNSKREVAKPNTTKEKSNAASQSSPILKESNDRRVHSSISCLAITVSLIVNNAATPALTFLITNKQLVLRDLRPYIIQQLRLTSPNEFVFMNQSSVIPIANVCSSFDFYFDFDFARPFVLIYRKAIAQLLVYFMILMVISNLFVFMSI